jgi:hypothetical protein
MDKEDLSFQIGLRVLLRTLEAGALGADAEALPSDQRDLFVTLVVEEATGVWQATLALSLTMTMLVGRESIKLEGIEDVMVAARKCALDILCTAVRRATTALD